MDKEHRSGILAENQDHQQSANRWVRDHIYLVFYMPLSYQQQQYLYHSYFIFSILHSASCGLWLINFMEYWTGASLSDNVTLVI
jgi:hypothetical protein